MCTHTMGQDKGELQIFNAMDTLQMNITVQMYWELWDFGNGSVSTENTVLYIPA